MTTKADTLIFNATLITMDKDLSVINKGAIAVSGNRILTLGSQTDLLAHYSAVDQVDAGGGIVMPGLINTHTHLAMVLLRGLAEDLALQPWLHKVWKAESAIMSPNNVEIGARLGLIESIMSGVTTAIDMYWYPERTARVAQSIGFRLANGPVFLDSNTAPDGILFSERGNYASEFMAEFQDDPLIIPMFMPHSTATDSPTALKQVKELSDKHNVMLNMHCAETEGEANDVYNRYGKTPVALLDSIGLLDKPTVLAHCVHVTQSEIEILAQKRVLVAHNPVSNLKLASGIAPVTEMLQAGVKVGIGTDGAQSSNDLNLWLPIRLAALLQKVQQQDASIIMAQQAVKMATIDAAIGMGLGDQIGSLEPGKKADLIILRKSAPHMVPMYNLYAQLVYAAGRDDVDNVMINGKWIMRNRELLTADLQDCLKRVNYLTAGIQSYA